MRLPASRATPVFTVNRAFDDADPPIPVVLGIVGKPEIAIPIAVSVKSRPRNTLALEKLQHRVSTALGQECVEISTAPTIGVAFDQDGTAGLSQFIGQLLQYWFKPVGQ